MEFRTKIDIKKSSLEIDYQSRMVLVGSCFAENMGNKLSQNKFRVNSNPFGILYNPLSISKVLNRIVDNDPFSSEELFYYNDLYHSWLHHGDFSFSEKGKTLAAINSSFEKAVKDLADANLLIVTFGTSYVYKLKSTGEVVANCHKVPAREFDRYRLDVQEIIEEWTKLINRLKRINPNINILFTVSPIRHWKDGAHENQLSKAILLLAIEELQNRFENTFYFPAYEILLDELRDYRFYAEDMIHPATVAVEYIWSVFTQTYFSETTKSIVKEWKKLKQAVEHKPFNRDTPVHKEFLRQTLLKLYAFKDKYPYFDCAKEHRQLELQLK